MSTHLLSILRYINLQQNIKNYIDQYPKWKEDIENHYQILQTTQPLLTAIEKGYLPSIKILLPPESLCDSSQIDNLWIIDSINKDRFDIVAFLLFPLKNINQGSNDEDKFQLLEEATKRTNLDIINYLIKKDISPLLHLDYLLAVTCSLHNNQGEDEIPPILELYLSYLPQPSSPIQNSEESNQNLSNHDKVLEIAIYYNNIPAVNLLISCGKLIFNKDNHHLITLAAETGCIEIVNILGESGFNITCLQGSIIPGLISTCIFNLMVKFDHHQINFFVDEMIKVIRKEFRSYWNMMKYLITNGINVNIPTELLFTIELNSENNQLMTYIYQKGFIFKYSLDTVIPKETKDLLSFLTSLIGNKRNEIQDVNAHLIQEMELRNTDSQKVYFYGMRKIEDLQSSLFIPSKKFDIDEYFLVKDRNHEGDDEEKLTPLQMGISLEKLKLSSGRKGYKSLELHNFCKLINKDKKGGKKMDLVNILTEYFYH